MDKKSISIKMKENWAKRKEIKKIDRLENG
jgi:hypothetical protein